jgi:hypothetical protein
MMWQLVTLQKSLQICLDISTFMRLYLQDPMVLQVNHQIFLVDKFLWVSKFHSCRAYFYDKV